LLRAFPLDIPMVPSSTLVVAADGEHLSHDVFSLGKTIHLGSLEFIADRFDDLSLFSMGDSSNAAVMDSTHDRPPSPLRVMTGDSAEEFHTTSDGEGRIDLPSPRRHDTGASIAPSQPYRRLVTGRRRHSKAVHSNLVGRTR
jgi:hypothetical protein